MASAFYATSDCRDSQLAFIPIMLTLNTYILQTSFSIDMWGFWFSVLWLFNQRILLSFSAISLSKVMWLSISDSGSSLQNSLGKQSVKSNPTINFRLGFKFTKFLWWLTNLSSPFQSLLPINVIEWIISSITLSDFCRIARNALEANSAFLIRSTLVM